MKTTWFTKRADKPQSAADVAGKLAEAQSELQAAEQRVEQARGALAAERSDGAREALREAKLAVEDILEMVAVVRAEHAQALERDAAADLARRNAKAFAMEAELSPTKRDESAEELFKLEMAALEGLIDARLRREEQLVAFERRIIDYRAFCKEIDREPKALRNHPGGAHRVRKALETLAQEAGPGPRRDLLLALVAGYPGDSVRFQSGVGWI